MSDSSQFVADLVAECITRMEHEGEAAVDAVCAEHPEHAQVVRRRLKRLDDMGLLHDEEAPAPPDPLPERVAGHRLLRRLGAGGMGVVFVAEQERLNRRVALKLVRPEQVWFPGARARFAREAELVAALNHPGIVPVYEVGEDAGLPWLSMELVPGASLEELLRAFAGRAPASLSGADLRRVVEAAAAAHAHEDDGDDAEHARGVTTRESHSRSSDGGELFDASWTDAALRIAAHVADALAYAHDQGVLHRDVKPSNVLVGVDGRVRLLDFGLAVRDGSAKLTVTGQLLGSLAYMPPERLRGGDESRDPRGDVYSLGATLFELLTLHAPFEARSAEALRRAILDGRAPSPRARNPSLSKDVEAVCAVALDPEPSRRYADAAAFAADLRRLLAREPVLARRPSGARRAWGWARRRPALAAAVALAALLAVGVPTAYALVARRHAEALRDALDDTLEERNRAERNLDLARSAVDTLLVDISGEHLDAVPGVDTLRRDLRAAAVEFYNAILEQRSDSRELVLRRLDVLRRVASTRGLLGDLAASRAGFERVSEEVAALRAAPPPGGGAWTAAELDQLARFEFIATFGRVDTNRFFAGDAAQHALVHEALDIARARAETSPDPMARYDLGNVLGVAGVGATVDGADGDAIPLMTEALDVLAALADTDLEPELVLGRRMECVYSLSQHLYELGLDHELEEQTLLEVIRQGAAIQADVEARYGTDELPLQLRENRALLLGGMAQTLGELGASAESEQLYRFALRDGEAVVAAAPQRYFPLVFLASNTHELATAVNRAGRRSEALDLLRPLVPRVLAAHDAWPEVEQVRGTAALMTSRLGLLLLQTDLLDEARAVLPALLEIIEEPSEFHLAGGHPLIDGVLARWEQAERDADGEAALVARIVAAREAERARGTDA